MEQLQLIFKGKASIEKAVRVGNVGSGDLEVLCEVTDSQNIEVDIATSIDNREAIWQSVLERTFTGETPSMKVTINDFGATPGVIGLRVEQALEQLNTDHVPAEVIKTGVLGESFIEMNTRQRCQFILDDVSFREVLGCEAHTISPWLMPQGVVPQTDDGCVVAKGTINGRNSVVIGIEGIFQGGSMGEISGAKMSAAMDLALRDNQKGIDTQVVLLLETGGVRLQEANLGLAAIADIHSSIIALRQYVPVIGVVAGVVGCFGGMSIAAALCSSLIVTKEARLGLNGPEVIEQEAGIEEYDSRNRPFIWSLTGGEQRFNTGLVDFFTEDDADQIRLMVVEQIEAGKPASIRCENVEYYLSVLSSVDTSVQTTSEMVREYYAKGASHE
ncbi:biotin-independent malonate decarboxylase subunit beta [Vibrio owensii]|uniref:biotin-independent malonate decarboxylase subunit beta n=1 Tax=Vibrio owensii TaxID=696485 RepID=UPI003AAECA4C